MLQILETRNDLVTIQASGKLSAEDYEEIIPDLESLVARNRSLRLLILLQNFEGWTGMGLVEELHWSAVHKGDYSKIAIVGDNRWLELGVRVLGRMFHGEMRSFPPEEQNQARAWLLENHSTVRVSPPKPEMPVF